MTSQVETEESKLAGWKAWVKSQRKCYIGMLRHVLPALLHFGPVEDSGWSSRIAPYGTHCSSQILRWPWHEWRASWCRKGKNLAHQINLCNSLPGHSFCLLIEQELQVQEDLDTTFQRGSATQSKARDEISAAQTLIATYPSNRIDLETVSSHPNLHSFPLWGITSTTSLAGPELKQIIGHYQQPQTSWLSHP